MVYLSARLGRKVMIWGKIKQRIKTIIIGTVKGRHAFTTWSMGSLLILVSTNSTMPKGGVSCPIIRLMHMMTPNSRRSMPALVHNGTKMGVKRMMDSIVDIKQPAIRRKKFRISRIKNGSVVTLKIASAKRMGILVRVST